MISSEINIIERKHQSRHARQIQSTNTKDIQLSHDTTTFFIRISPLSCITKININVSHNISYNIPWSDKMFLTLVEIFPHRASCIASISLAQVWGSSPIFPLHHWVNITLQRSSTDAALFSAMFCRSYSAQFKTAPIFRHWEATSSMMYTAWRSAVAPSTYFKQVRSLMDGVPSRHKN